MTIQILRLRFDAKLVMANLFSCIRLHRRLYIKKSFKFFYMDIEFFFYVVLICDRDVCRLDFASEPILDLMKILFAKQSFGK